MKRMRLLGWTFGMMIFSMASLALPLPASANLAMTSVTPVCTLADLTDR